ncbi:MAG: ABC transporter ATP-binding protein, partial [Intestinibacter sp.]|uniref:ABC transporter ATP-binding protein n=1 Tax=Intestinibacter sp. TaxID=1965304 RepID=UPI003F16787E
EFRDIRGNDIAMIFQHPELMLDPIMSIGNLFYETMKVHDENISKDEALKRAKDILIELNLEDVDRILDSYPFELSGGMCQRVAIGMAMVNNPKLLLADEPTSALDVTVQLQVVETLIKMREKYKTSILIVTHNMGVVAKMVDKIGVMYGGKIVEWGDRDSVLKNPLHPYTKALIKAIPKMDCKLPEGIDIKAKEFDLKSDKCGFKSICDRYTDKCKNTDTKKYYVDDEHWILCCKEDKNDIKG